MRSKKLIITMFSICLLGTLGFTFSNSPAKDKNFITMTDLLNKTIDTSKQVKELPIKISEDKLEKTIKIQVGEEVFAGKLNNNTSAEAFAKKLPLTLSMKDLNQNEKFYFLEENLPTNSKPVQKIETGDIMLYGSDCLVLFYESFDTSYSYTSIGKILEPEKLKEVLGKEDVTVSFDIAN